MFAGLTELTEVNLNENSLTELTAGVFPGLAALRVLVLEGNALDGLGLSDNVFEPLTDLSTLWLQHNPGAPFLPTAVALPDDGRVPVAGGAVTLDGSTSGGEWGTNVTYAWALTTPTSGVTFDDNTSAMPVVTIPVLAADTELTFTLTVYGRAYRGSGSFGLAPDTDTVRANTAPTATDSSVTTNEDTAHPFAAAEFGFADADADADGDALASVRVVTLPGAGALALDGAAVMAGQAVAAADIGKLVFNSALNGNGTGYASFSFRVSDGAEESASASTMTVNVRAVNDAATGAPAISGTARVGETLTAARTGILDVDALTSATYGYQWVRVDAGGASNPTDIGADSNTYTLVAGGRGQEDQGGGELYRRRRY